VDPEKLGEGPLANKQVWISRMEAAMLAKEKINETGDGGVQQTELKGRGRLNQESRDSEEH
jgi:hypothetical protein